MRFPKPNDIKNFFTNHRLLRQLKVWAKRHSLPGFFKVPIFDVVVFVFNELRRYDLMTRANSIAFSFFLSLFPSLIALFTLIPLLKDLLISYLPQGENFDYVLQTEIQRIMPGVAGERVFNFVEDITSKPRFDLLSFGFFLAVIFASNGMLALMRGFDKSYMRTFKKRAGLRKRLIAMVLIGFVGIILISSVVLLLVGNSLIHWLTQGLGLDHFTEILLNGLRWVVILMLFYFSIAIIYRYGAATRKKFKFFTPGAALAVILCVLSSVIFSAYVNNFNTYNKLYGSIGTIIVLMLWLQINSLFILVGFELNASIAINRDLKQQIQEDENL